MDYLIDLEKLIDDNQYLDACVTQRKEEIEIDLESINIRNSKKLFVKDYLCYLIIKAKIILNQQKLNFKYFLSRFKYKINNEED